ncbi:MAG: regulatory iron-sulfur-containing complex subunit RicT [Bacilli bacterium]|nr:regulatory iron-sulfur-containing complex subunit RicT [Bacilli bacterium]
MNIVEVKFDDSIRTSFFKNNKFNLKNNLTIIVDGERGLQFGKVVKIIEDDKKLEKVVEYEVVRVSTKRDYLQHLKNLKNAESALIKCRDIVKDYNLSMNIIDASYNFDGSQLLFRFVADERIDFRDLVKDLGSVFKTRIELRQVGIRDKAKEVGGIGPCGRLLCCSSFLNSFDSVTINMAKNQNLSLNPTKINGVCGRLLCCLKYENDIYSDYKKNLPKLNSKIEYNGEMAKVIFVDALKSKYKLELSDKTIVEIDVDESKK